MRTKPGHYCLPQLFPIPWKLLRYKLRQRRPPPVYALGHLVQQHRKVIAVNKSDKPRDGGCEEKHDPKGHYADCGKLASFAMNPHYLKNPGKELHQFVD